MNGDFFAATYNYNGVYKLQKGLWTEANCGIKGATNYGLSSGPNGIYVATSNKIYHLPNSGSKWKRSGKDVPSEYIQKIEEFDSNLYAIDYNQKLYFLKNGDSTWKPFQGLVAKQGKFQGVLIHSDRLLISSGSKLYTISGDSLVEAGGAEGLGNYLVANGSVYATNTKEIFKSLNGGVTFSKIVDAGTLNVNHIWSWAVSGKNICVGSFNQGIFISRDEGLTWSHCWQDTSQAYFSGFVKQVMIKGNMIIASVNGNGKLIASYDWGQSWVDYNEGLSVNYKNDLVFPCINGVVAMGDTLYVALSYEGVFRRTLQASKITQAHENKLCLSLHPNPCDEKLEIKIGSLEGSANLSLFSATGQCLWNCECSGNDTIVLDVLRFNVGAYFVMIRSGTETCTSKFIRVYSR